MKSQSVANRLGCKSFAPLSALLVTLSLYLLPAVTSQAELEVSASVQIHATTDFHAPLATHGAWIEAGSYGRCWRPAHVAVGWRPYCSGSWVWTDNGWYWASDEPWAWACYHYGRWVLDTHHGWVWVPDVEWAPAWVSWRTGGAHIGWAPLPPAGHVSVTIATPSLFVFVGTAHFTSPIHPSTVIINNKTIFKQTKVLPQASRETRNIPGVGSRKIMVNHGPQVAAIEKATGKILKPVSVREVAARTHGPSVARSNKGATDKNSKPATDVDRQGGHEDRTASAGPDKNQGGRKADRGGAPDRGLSPDRNRSRGGFFGGSGGGGGGGGRGGRGKGR